MSRWKEVRLGEIVDINKHSISNEYNGNILYVDIASVENGILKEYKEFDFLKAPSRAKRIVNDRNIIYSTVRPNLKAFYMFGENIPSNVIASTGFVVLSEKIGASIDYIYYHMTNQSLVDYLSQIAKGAAYPAVAINDFYDLKIKIPDLKTQEKIANILSTYDKLIENNNRRIEILEKTAEEIYKEWFVRMRFPGYKEAKLKKGIPMGWEAKKVGDVASLVHGYTESATEETIGPKFLRGTDINKNSYIKWSEVPYCKIDNNNIQKYRLWRYDIVIIRMADPGKVAIIEEDITAIFASYLIKIKYKNNKIKPYYLFYTLHSEGYQEYIKGFSSGTTRYSINSKMILNSKILIPPIKIQEGFNNRIIYIRNMLNVLLKQNQNLIKQRDLLLPRLIDGTIEVK